ncbi:MAG: hypothetical protein JWO80_3078 [Bryobacterales bacterium]|nr:hypothetical protein [Bryobacterales bacterium]
MACPDCGSPAGSLRLATPIETHGLDCGPYEIFNEEFVVCRECGGRCDIHDWDNTPELGPEVLGNPSNLPARVVAPARTGTYRPQPASRSGKKAINV